MKFDTRRNKHHVTPHLQCKTFFSKPENYLRRYFLMPTSPDITIKEKIWDFLRLFAASRDLAITELLWRTGQMLCQNTPHVLHTTRTGRTQNVLCKNIKHSV